MCWLAEWVVGGLIRLTDFDFCPNMSFDDFGLLYLSEIKQTSNLDIFAILLSSSKLFGKGKSYMVPKILSS